MLAKRELGLYYHKLAKKAVSASLKMKRYQKAAEWFIEAGKDGDPISSSYLGELLYYGEGLKRGPEAVL